MPRVKQNYDPSIGNVTPVSGKLGAKATRAPKGTQSPEGQRVMASFDILHNGNLLIRRH